MVKTTINLETDVYKELVEESIEKYGTTKKLSKLINYRLKKSKGKGSRDIVKETAGLWKLSKSAYKDVKGMRLESEKRTLPIK